MTEKKKKQLRELIRYGFVGAATTVVNLASYHGMLLTGMDYKIANLIAIVLAKVFAYYANKRIVFRSRCASWKDTVLEAIRYIVTRGATGLIDYFGLILSVEYLGLDKILMKYVLQIVVIISNYLFGKFVVFHNKEKNESE